MSLNVSSSISSGLLVIEPILAPINSFIFFSLAMSMILWVIIPSNTTAYIDPGSFVNSFSYRSLTVSFSTGFHDESYRIPVSVPIRVFASSAIFSGISINVSSCACSACVIRVLLCSCSTSALISSTSFFSCICFRYSEVGSCF